jgi:hypothetical protein
MVKEYSNYGNLTKKQIDKIEDKIKEKRYLAKVYSRVNENSNEDNPHYDIIIEMWSNGCTSIFIDEMIARILKQ